MAVKAGFDGLTTSTSVAQPDGRRAVPVAMVRQIDAVAFALIFVMAALPYGQVYVIYAGPAVVNTHELLQLLLIGILGFRGLFLARSSRILPALLIFALTGFFLVDTVLFREMRTSYLVVQLRALLPYLAATLLLWTGTTIPARRVLYWLSIAGLISASAALVIHYFFPGFVKQAFFGHQFFIAFQEIGRLWWPNVSLAFIPIILLMETTLRRERVSWLVVLAAAVTTAGLINTLNRTLLAGMVLFMVLVFWKGRKEAGIGRLTLVIASVAAVCAVAIIVAGLLNPSFFETAQARLLGSADNFDPSSLYEMDFRQERIPLYRQYFSAPWQTIVLGRGFGVPFASGMGMQFVTTDVSLFSFLLPLGIAGVVAFGAFLVTLWRTVPPEPGSRRLGLPTMAKMWLVAAVFISLNVDVFSRDALVLFLTLLVVSLRADAFQQAPDASPAPGGNQPGGNQPGGNQPGGRPVVGAAGSKAPVGRMVD